MLWKMLELLLIVGMLLSDVGLYAQEKGIREQLRLIHQQLSTKTLRSEECLIKTTLALDDKEKLEWRNIGWLIQSGKVEAIPATGSLESAYPSPNIAKQQDATGNVSPSGYTGIAYY